MSGRKKEKLEETKAENEVRRNKRTNKRKGKTLRKRKARKKKTNLSRTTSPPKRARTNHNSLLKNRTL